MRYLHDLKEALVRVVVAHEGLKRYFGYTEPIPINGVEEHLLFDECLIWVRQSISYLIKLKRLDQQLGVTIPLRALSEKGGASWNDVLQNGSFKFELDQKDFYKGYSLLRLRSVGLSVISKEPQKPKDLADLWRMELTQMSSKTVCPALRVCARNPLRDPEPAGSEVLYNSSPFGKWNLTFNTSSVSGKRADQVIEDIWLDINCVGQKD